MNIILTQKIMPTQKILDKHGTPPVAPIEMRTAWSVDDEMWHDSPEVAFLDTAMPLRPAAIKLDGKWMDTEIIEPAGIYSLICAIANAFCEYTGLQLFKSNMMLAHPELAGKNVPRNPEHDKRLCHMCVRAMWGTYPDKMDEKLLADLCRYVNWDVLDTKIEPIR